jgi:16S rRNA (guanine966-N2)-methyltransferase
MRIVAGTARGRVLKTPAKADVIRPTADRVRETLFNVLGQWCEGLEVLDLFAGTGALGLEAVSRGASRAVLVDSGREALALCRENAEALGFKAVVEVLASPVDRALVTLGQRKAPFDLVFADPPYALKAGLKVLEGLAANGLLKPGARVVIESDEAEELPETVGALAQVDRRIFGATGVTIYSLGLTPTPS